MNNSVRTNSLLATVVILITTQFALSQTPRAPQPGRPLAPVKARTPVALEPGPPARQVVTVLHRLNGLKMFRLLIRSQDQVEVISNLDEASALLDDVHTNVIAGLALDDGQTIATWLPEAELEFGPVAAFAPLPNSSTPQGLPSQRPAVPMVGRLLNSPELTVISSDGKKWAAQYIGLDGITGLSILKLTSRNPLPGTGARIKKVVAIGENVRLLGPEPVSQLPGEPSGSLFVRVGEVNGTIWNVTTTSAGEVSRFRVRASRLNNMNVGGVALNTAGDAVGIVDAVQGTDATILPASLIRKAAERVLSQQASVPKPWLGVKGEPVMTLKAGQFQDLGWEAMKASTLVAGHKGILLTSIAPGSPAALAALKAGDVILKVNDAEIQNADDFSWELDQNDPGKSIQVTVARPNIQTSEIISVKLGGALSARTPFLRREPFATFKNFALIGQGVETIALKPAVASQFGATAGLLVVYVEPSTPAASGGLQAGDVIQTIDGQPLPLRLPHDVVGPNTPAKSHTFEVVRYHQKLTLTIAAPDKNK